MIFLRRFTSLFLPGVFALASPCLPPVAAQGALTPPVGAPLPTQKSLQELWDKLAAVEAQQAALRTLLLQTVVAEHLPWRVSVVESVPVDATTAVSLAIDASGQPALAYHGGAAGGLRYATRSRGVWSLATVLGGTTAGHLASLAFGPDGQPGIACFDEDAGGRVLFSQRRLFTFPFVPAGATVAPARSAEPAPAGSGVPLLNYTWLTSIVDTTPGAGEDLSLAYAPNGDPTVTYQVMHPTDPFMNGLFFARYAQGAWTRTFADSLGTGACHAYGPGGQPAIVHTRGAGNYLHLATTDGVSWSSGSIGGMSALPPHLAFAPDGAPALAYADLATDQLHFARAYGATWIHTAVPEGGAGGQAVLAFGPDGQPAIACHDGPSGDVRFVRLAGGRWLASRVTFARLRHGPRALDLAFGTDGQPVIALLDAHSGTVQLAERIVPGT